jgi:hypothetical protein
MSETPDNRPDNRNENFSNNNLFELPPSQDLFLPEEEGVSSVEPQVLVEQEWVTVNFPDAIGADDVPRDPEPSQTNIRMQELDQQNRHLFLRVSELETALAQSQTALNRSEALLKTETERLERLAGFQFAEAEQRAQRDAQLAHQQAELIAKQRLALDAAKQKLHEQETVLHQRSLDITDAHTQIKQLSQNVDLGHQAHQKQQILIETLTGQLQVTQERVAQLERECSGIKQRYDEQVQLTRQADNTCKDLRSRLNRQQQYTLQFKTALEKCLDVPTAQVSIMDETDQRVVSTPHNSDGAIEDETCNLSPTSFVKAQPVQPWSSGPGFPAFSPELEEPPIWMPDPEIPSELRSSQIAESEDFSLDLLDPMGDVLEEFSPPLPEGMNPWSEPEEQESFTSPKSLSYTIHRSQSEETDQEGSSTTNRVQLFAVPSGQPSVEPEVTLGSSEVTVESSTTVESSIIDVESVVAESRAEATVVQSDERTQDILIQPEEETSAITLSHNPWGNAFETGAEVFVVVEDPTPFDGMNSEVQDPSFVRSSSPFFTLASDVNRSGSVDVGAAQRSSPSPVVHPTKPKKRSSFAAVDLPSFPRSAK